MISIVWLQAFVMRGRISRFPNHHQQLRLFPGILSPENNEQQLLVILFTILEKKRRWGKQNRRRKLTSRQSPHNWMFVRLFPVMGAAAPWSVSG